MIGFARNAGLRRQEADDVLQQVLLGFFRVSAQFEYDPSRGRFRGYLKRATLNAVRALHRDRRAGAPLEAETALCDPRSSGITWDHEWSKQLLRRALAHAMRQFSPRSCEAFELYGLKGVPVEIVAERLGMSCDAVRKAKSRVMSAVRERILELRDAEG